MNEQIASKVLAGLSLALLLFVVVMGLFGTGPDVLQGEYVRMLYLHPASAWTAYVAFGVTTLCSILWLVPRTRKQKWDQIAGASAEIGVVFTALALLTGSIWGRPTWNTWWVWDARTTSTALLLFMYLGVLAVRRVPASFEARALRSAITALIAFLDVPIVHFSVKWWRTQHQEASLLRPDGPTVHGWQLVTMLVSFLAFTVFYLWLLVQRYRISRWEDRLEQSGLQAAIAARRAEASRSSASVVGGVS
jgi:heme exporter protein C